MTLGTVLLYLLNSHKDVFILVKTVTQRTETDIPCKRI